VILRLSPRALSDIDDALAYLRSESPKAAEALSERFDEVFARLSIFPATGRLTSKTSMRCANTLPFPYLIFYKTSRDLIEIVAVQHGARNPRSMPARPR
jgi:toxin ParE1/3/4